MQFRIAIDKFIQKKQNEMTYEGKQLLIMFYSAINIMYYT